MVRPNGLAFGFMPPVIAKYDFIQSVRNLKCLTVPNSQPIIFSVGIFLRQLKLPSGANAAVRWCSALFDPVDDTILSSDQI